ncbi:hypothetical protein [Pseudarthrobacter sulfonivorans]|uniref:hypothetical protein n=1 Tax=Pseudarthrobacter sulfonivorans TaxID=121292 RepID=UPI00210263CB|nr:hypothetical protein [Pseudarthrobacter sulfonivorans]
MADQPLPRETVIKANRQRTERRRNGEQRDRATFWFRSIDGMHNGLVGGVNLDGGGWHDFPGPHQYPASWCAIPWVNRGDTYKDLSSNLDRHVLRFWSDAPSIYFADGTNGQLVAQVVLTDFADHDIDLDLSITAGGIYLEFLSVVGPTNLYVISSSGKYTEVDRDGLANVLGNVAGGTIHLGQAHKRRHQAGAHGGLRGSSRLAPPQLAVTPPEPIRKTLDG